MASVSAEQAVKKLARLPGNTVCPNCGTTKKFGFGTVCIKYLTFVCNNCKSSHQAISHRCKSLTMSSWTEGEVLQLKTHGNDHARATWLANAPPIGTHGRPKEGDPIDVFKRFIVDAYEHKKYYSEGGGGGAPPPPPVQAPAAPTRIAPAPISAPIRIPPQTTLAPAPAQVVPPPPPAPVVEDLFAMDFAAAPAAVPATAVHDPFAPVTTTTMMPPPAVASAPVSAPLPPTFDPFPQSMPAPAKKPVMNSGGGGMNAISSMGGGNIMSSHNNINNNINNNTAMNNSGFGFMNNNPGMMMNNHMGMPTNPMMGNNNMNAMQQQQQMQHMMMMMQQQMGMMGMPQGGMPPMSGGGGFGRQPPPQPMGGGPSIISAAFGAPQPKNTNANNKPDPFANLF